ncbi:MAG: acetyl-CoA decarbonylase/synthase complex subunit gamma [Clostridiales bacterium]|jgi:acetyl-CoA decarbonylase/synthase complex subunit gamma|nr:acetyl-CoA decarbonylase/synthase complex subunit gamma [Clostridiales bacterium]
MALKGLDIFKLTPKTNCKDCGVPTCMAFAMKVAQGSVQIGACPHMSDEALAALGEATAPPMKLVKIGAGEREYALGGETVLFRHEKAFVSKNLFGVALKPDSAERVLPEVMKIDYERIGERMHVELLHVGYGGSGNGDMAGSGNGDMADGGSGDRAAFLDTVRKAAAAGRTLVIECGDAGVAREALELAKDGKPLLNGANPSNYAEMARLAEEYGVALGVGAPDIGGIYDTVQALEGLGCKNLVIDVGAASAKEAFANAVQIRRAAIKDSVRSLGYPSLVNLEKLAPGNPELQLALASVFVLKYGSIIIMGDMSYAQALPLFGLRQNIFTDPQKPMTVEPGVYPINGADESAICATTVNFALTYFIISGELQRSGVPVNLLISDAGGYSVLTAWAAGKLSAASLEKFFSEQGLNDRLKNRTLLIPGKVAVLKGEIEESLPGWNIVVAPNEAVGIVKFMKELSA